MSVYQNFIWDFPSRCSSILSDFERRATFRRLEVTTMLSIASAGLIIPYARLMEGKHPSRDRKIFKMATERFQELGKKNFLEYFLEDESKSWRYGEIPDDTGTVEQWKDSTVSFEEMETRIITGEEDKKRRSCYILYSLRNALAHGNIFTPGQGEIEDLVFLSRVKKGSKEYSVIVVTPADFREFLQRWFESIRDISMPESLMGDCYPAAIEGFA